MVGRVWCIVQVCALDTKRFLSEFNTAPVLMPPPPHPTLHDTNPPHLDNAPLTLPIRCFSLQPHRNLVGGERTFVSLHLQPQRLQRLLIALHLMNTERNGNTIKQDQSRESIRRTQKQVKKESRASKYLNDIVVQLSSLDILERFKKKKKKRIESDDRLTD